MEIKPRKKRLPVYKPIDKPLQLSPNRRQHNFLLALALFHYLTAELLSDVCGYLPSTLPTSRVALSQLFHSRFVRRLRPLMDRPFGSSPLVYALTKKSYAYLASQGRAPSGRFRSAEEAHRETFFLKHTLTANALLIRLIMLTKCRPVIKVLRMLAERELKRKAVRVQVKVDSDKVKLQNVQVVPDGWIELKFPDRNCELLLELDRGTVDRTRIQAKVQAYLPYLERHYPAIFQVEHPNPVVLVVTTAGADRLEHLVEWTEAILTHCQAKHRNNLFRFAAFDPHKVGPEVVFSPIWIGPFSRTPIPLFRQ